MKQKNHRVAVILCIVLCLGIPKLTVFTVCFSEQLFVSEPGQGLEMEREIQQK